MTGLISEVLANEERDRALVLQNALVSDINKRFLERLSVTASDIGSCAASSLRTQSLLALDQLVDIEVALQDLLEEIAHIRPHYEQLVIMTVDATLSEEKAPNRR